MAWYRSKKKGSGGGGGTNIGSPFFQDGNNSGYYNGYIPFLPNNASVGRHIDFSKDWTIKVRVGFTNSPSTSTKVCILGNVNDFYNSPSIEFSSGIGTASVGIGFSYNGSSWGKWQSVSLTEALVVDKYYDFLLSYTANTGTVSFKITKVETNTDIANSTWTVTNQQNQPSGTKWMEFGAVKHNNSYMQMKYQLYDFANSYIENDGVVIWGYKESA